MPELWYCQSRFNEPLRAQANEELDGQPLAEAELCILILSVATPAEPRGEKKLFLAQILGGEKLLKFVEKCR